jgi:hypothetical protein
MDAQMAQEAFYVNLDKLRNGVLPLFRPFEAASRVRAATVRRPKRRNSSTDSDGDSDFEPLLQEARQEKRARESSSDSDDSRPLVLPPKKKLMTDRKQTPFHSPSKSAYAPRPNLF